MQVYLPTYSDSYVHIRTVQSSEDVMIILCSSMRVSEVMFSTCPRQTVITVKCQIVCEQCEKLMVNTLSHKAY